MLGRGPLDCRLDQTQLYLIRVFPTEVSSITKVHRMLTKPFGGFIFFHQRNRGCPSLGPQTRKTVVASNKAGGFRAVPTGTPGAHFVLHPPCCLYHHPPQPPPGLFLSPFTPPFAERAAHREFSSLSPMALNFTGPKSLWRNL